MSDQARLLLSPTSLERRRLSSNSARDEAKSPRLDAASPAFFRLPEVSMPFASSVELLPARQPVIQPGEAFKLIGRTVPMIG